MSKKLSAKELSVNQDKVRLTAENDNLIVNEVDENGNVTPITSTKIRTQEISSLAYRSSGVIQKNDNMAAGGTYGLVVTEVETGSDTKKQTFTLKNRTFSSTPIVTATLEGASEDPTYDVSISLVEETDEAGIYQATFEFSDDLAETNPNGVTANYKLNVLAVVSGEDSDMDNIPDHIDLDDDNDGYSDASEIASGSDTTDPTSTPPDNDADGIPDALDPDDDNDGTLDVNDAFPFDGSETLDTDNDGIGNNTDLDDDGDGFSDQIEISRSSDPLDDKSTPDYVVGSFYKGELTNNTEIIGDDIPIVFLEDLLNTMRINHAATMDRRLTNQRDAYGRSIGNQRRFNYGLNGKLQSGTHYQWVQTPYREKTTVYNYSHVHGAADLTTNGDLAYTPRGWSYHFESNNNFGISLHKVTESGNDFPTDNNIQWSTEFYNPDNYRSLPSDVYYQKMYGQSVGGAYPYSEDLKRRYNGSNSNRFYMAHQNFRLKLDESETFIFYQPQMPDKTNWGSDAYANAWMFKFTVNHQYRPANFNFLIKGNQNHIDTSNWGANNELSYSDIYDDNSLSPFNVKIERFDSSAHPAKLENSWLLSNDGASLVYYAGYSPVYQIFRDAFGNNLTSDIWGNRVGSHFLHLALGSESGNPNFTFNIPNLASAPFNKEQLGRGQRTGYGGGTYWAMYNIPSADQYYWDRDGGDAHTTLSFPSAWQFSSTLNSMIAI